MKKTLSYSLMVEGLLIATGLVIQINHMYFPFRSALVIITLLGFLFVSILLINWILATLKNRNIR